jgi:hypothetical protein
VVLLALVQLLVVLAALVLLPQLQVQVSPVREAVAAVEIQPEEMVEQEAVEMAVKVVVLLEVMEPQTQAAVGVAVQPFQAETQMVVQAALVS